MQKHFMEFLHSEFLSGNKTHSYDKALKTYSLPGAGTTSEHSIGFSNIGTG
jgi:hypothetical protein